MDNQEQYTLHFANDAGNDSMKAELNGEEIKMPSVIAFKNSQNLTAPIKFSGKDEQTKKYMENFLDNMDVTVSSAATQTQERFLVGNAAIDSHLPLTTFDVNDYSGKSESELTPLLTLSLIAGKRVIDAFNKGEDLSEPLKVTVFMTTALPISEGKRVNVIDRYAEKYTNASHAVTFHNFKSPITVSIKFKKIYVALEGEAALLAIRNIKKYPDLGASLMSNLSKNYPKIANRVSIERLPEIPGAMGIDIGGKTTDVSVIINRKVVSKLSISIMHGYDNVLLDAISYLQTNKFSFENVSQLQAYLNSPINPFDPSDEQNRQFVKGVIKEQQEILVSQIVKVVSQIMKQAGQGIKVIFVYGGGSIPMENSSLRKRLSEKITNFKQTLPILWVPKEYAQKMNLLGLKLIEKVISKH